jgi:hypothetical protein
MLHLLDLPPETLERIVSWLAPVDAVLATDDAKSATPLVQCSVPLACVCKSLSALILSAAVVDVLLGRAEGEATAGVLGHAAPEGATAGVLLRIAASWQRRIVAAAGATTSANVWPDHSQDIGGWLRGVGLQAHEARLRREGFDILGDLLVELTADELRNDLGLSAADSINFLQTLQEALLPAGSLHLWPVCASTTDHAYESIMETTKHPIQRWNSADKGKYWSSVAQEEGSEDYLVYCLPGLCTVDAVSLKAYEEGPPGDAVAFTWRAVQLFFAAQLPGSAAEGGALFRTEELAAADSTAVQTVRLGRPALARCIVVRLLGKRRQQSADTGWFVCVDHVIALGRQLLPWDEVYRVDRHDLAGGAAFSGRAGALKVRANAAFAARDYEGAAVGYGEALCALPRCAAPAGLGAAVAARARLAAVLHSNRAECWLRIADRAAQEIRRRAGDDAATFGAPLEEVYDTETAALAEAMGDCAAGLAHEPRKAKTVSRLASAGRMVAQAQAERCGDGLQAVPPATLARKELGGCAAKSAVEALLRGAWGAAAVALPAALHVEPSTANAYGAAAMGGTQA